MICGLISEDHFYALSVFRYDAEVYHIAEIIWWYWQFLIVAGKVFRQSPIKSSSKRSNLNMHKY